MQRRRSSGPLRNTTTRAAGRPAGLATARASRTHGTTGSIYPAIA